MYKDHLPSKILNSEASVMGLTVFDLTLIAGIYTVLNPIFYYLKMEIMNLIICILFTLFLIPIRLTQRRHIIRDYLQFYFIKYFSLGIPYDPKAHRHKNKKNL